MNPRISVLVPTYNRAHFLPQCLASLLAQTLPPFEIIVIDDGSTDGTPWLLRSYGEPVSYLRKLNGGKSSALNIGLEAVRGDYVWILDDDDSALPDTLERMVAPLEADSSLGMSFANYRVAPTRADGTLDLPGVEQELPKFPDCDLFLTQLRKGCLTAASTVFARTSLYCDVGPFDPRLIRSQDYDMALRLSRNCNAIRLQGSTHVFRTHDGLRGSETERFTAENRTAKWRIYDKIVMKKVRQETPLQDYLSRIGRPSTLSSLHMRQAYLQRSTIMARVGLYAEMLEDMRLALEVDSRSPLTQEEQNGFDVGGYRYHGKEGFWDSDFMQELKRLCGSPAGQEIGFQIAQQLYWHACYALRKGETREALRNLQSTLILLGVKGMASSVRYKAGLSKRRQTNGARAGERSPAEM